MEGTTEEENMDAMVEWGLERGIVMEGIRPAMVEQGHRGIVAQEKLGKSDLALPKTMLMSVETARSDPDIQIIEEQAKLHSRQVLGLHLLKECTKGKHSPWFLYLQQLPRRYTLLAHFLPEECLELQDDHAVNLCRQCRDIERKNWKQVRPYLDQLISNVKLRSFQAWLWATATLDSRTMFIEDDSAGVLTPIGDLFNYAPPPSPYLRTPEEFLGFNDDTKEKAYKSSQENNAGYGTYDAQSKQYHIITCSEYSKGDQIYLCYGKYTNLELLQFYGFMMEKNEHDQHSLSSWDLRDYCECTNIPSTHLPSTNLAVLINGCPSWNLAVLLRAQGLKHSRIPGSALEILLSGAPVSKESDALAFKLYVEICRCKLRSYPTTIEEDRELLRVAGSEKRALAISWRMHQKRMLMEGVNYGIKCLNLLLD
eukprot:CAMPEP_0113925918 /NCGR_PEP_ID=MMETSP1159-20121227/3468_1 /TAXON_ID=88271 /ORGANISM="Picocystis salinarum" /LENGTH=424 /DNA_ID=CAMNT_0000926257 /DNA_START=157 /DNA_END=1432 /DNA_ORIENTATION=+ /assembly_acc=CAM_ASM_000767